MRFIVLDVLFAKMVYSGAGTDKMVLVKLVTSVFFFGTILGVHRTHRDPSNSEISHVKYRGKGWRAQNSTPYQFGITGQP